MTESEKKKFHKDRIDQSSSIFWDLYNEGNQEVKDWAFHTLNHYKWEQDNYKLHEYTCPDGLLYDMLKSWDKRYKMDSFKCSESNEIMKRVYKKWEKKLKEWEQEREQLNMSILCSSSRGGVK